MTLLDFARGPGLYWAVTVMVIGILWRVAGAVLLVRRKDHALARDRNRVVAGLRAVAMRSVPPHELEKNITFQHITGYAWHLGWFATFLLLGVHIPFIKSFLGFGWPTLPNQVIMVIGAVTLAILLALLVRRLVHPVLKVISDADDYISALLTIAPLVTGFVTYAHMFPERHETMIGLHLLSVELLMVWLPFGKIIHCVTALPLRYQVGSTMARRGVEA
jgi:nitrate reductase gamma subunit